MERKSIFGAQLIILVCVFSLHTDFTGGFQELSISEERVVAAAQKAYKEYVDFLQGIMKDLRLRLGDINKAEQEIIENEGTLFKIHFEIVYIPAGDIMDCYTLVLDNLGSVFDVKNVSCDCCRENKVTNEDYIIGVHTVSTSDQRVITAVQFAYNAYAKFLDGIGEDIHLGEINKAEYENVENKGTLFKIKFEIVYIPAGDVMDCDTIVLENLVQGFDVKNVSCDCCRDKDDIKVTNINNAIGFDDMYTNKSVIIDNANNISNVTITNEKTKDGIHNEDDDDISIVTGNQGCFHKQHNVEERAVTPTQFAYDEFIDYIEANEEDFSLGKINNVENEFIESEGTYFKITFEIDYIPDEVTMECDTTVLENLENAYEVKNVTCDCCLDQYASETLKRNVPDST